MLPDSKQAFVRGQIHQNNLTNTAADVLVAVIQQHIQFHSGDACFCQRVQLLVEVQDQGLDIHVQIDGSPCASCWCLRI